MIAIINYGLGNINAFINVYKKLNIQLKVARNEGDLEDIDRIILPGVGSFDQAMIKLNESGMRRALDRLVLDKHIPVIGICVGMQMLALSSEEGDLPGLGYVNATVKKFNVNDMKPKLNLPHMGWNDVRPLTGNGIFSSIDNWPVFYFLHSYYFSCNETGDAIATSDYGGEFVCAIRHHNIFGVQFHPEKSHQYGIQLLKNFSEV